MTGTTISGIHLASVTLISGTTPNPVTVASGATISASGTALVGEVGTSWTVIDYGNVEGSGETGTGIYLASSNASSGSIFNESGGTISGTYHGINLGAGTFAGVGTISNHGTILGGDVGPDPAAIFLSGGGYVTNLSGGVISAASTGILGFASFTDTVANQGLITASGNGVYISTGGSVTNQSGGVIHAGGNGIELLVATSSTYTGSVTNLSGGTIIAGDNGIVLNQDTALTAINQGVILAANDGVALGEGGYVANQVGGTISGTSAGVFATGGAATLLNAGTIAGSGAAGYAVTLAPGYADRLVVDPGAVFIGTVSGGNTVGATAISGAPVVSTLEFASGAAAGTFSGLGTKYIDFAHVTVDAGATWTLTGSATLAAGYALTNSGTLTDAGSLLVAGALLNSAAISGGVLLSGGTVVNAQGATITGLPGAVYGTTGGSAGTVFNQGLLKSSTDPSRSAGVALLAGGLVSNGSNGIILGGAGGVIIYNAANTLSNQGTVLNYGSIGGIGTHANGVELDSGGLISNAAGGTISGSNHGAEIDVASAGQTALVENQGFIYGSSTGNAGVYLQGGGTVSNTGTGTILGGQQGVVFGASGSAGGTLVNRGDIAAAGVAVAFFKYGNLTNAGTIGGATETGDAVSFASGYDNRLTIDPGAVFNGTVDGGNAHGATAASTLDLASGATAGTLSGLGTKYIDFTQITIASGATWTLSSVPAGDTITDLGTLIDTGTFAAAVSLGAGVYFHNVSGAKIVGSGTFAIAGGSGATVVNAGVIDPANYGVFLPAGGTVTNVSGGTIVGTAAGVKVSGAPGTVVNAGSIYGAGPGSSGVELDSGGSVTNQAGGTIDGVLYGIDSSNTATITNSGRIGVIAFDAIGLTRGLVTNAATGTIAGASAGILIYTGGTVVDAGTISGGSDAIYFHANYTNRLVVDPGAVFNGTVQGSNIIGATAVSTLELASGASNGFLTGLGAKYVNFGQVTLDAGATWVLDGSNTLAAGATLTAGTTLAGSSTLVVNGSLTENGLVTINDGVLAVGGGAGTNGTLAVDAHATVDLTGESSTSDDLVIGIASTATGTVVVSGTGALLDSDAPISVAPSAGATALLMIASGGSVFAETGLSSTSAAVGLADRGTGTVVVTGHGSELTADGLFYDGRAAGSSGTLLVENQGSVVLNADLAGNAAELEVGVGNSSTGSLTGGEGSATVTSGGVLNSGSLIYIGGDGDSGGTLTVTSGTVAGTSTVLGGTVMAAGIALGVNTGSTGGGAGFLNIGSGALVETLGTTTTAFTVAIGRDAGSSGTATVAGRLIANGQIVVGNNGSEVSAGSTLAGAVGLLTVTTGGTVTAGDGFFIGNQAGATGTVVVNGGALTSAPAGGGNFVALGVGSSGSGTLVVEGGGTVTATQSPGPAFDVAISTGSQGTATVSGTNSLLRVNGQLNVGDEGSGWLDVNTGALVNAGTHSVSIGVRSGGAGTISVESDGTLIGGALSVAEPVSGSASGTLAVGGGGTVAVASLSEADGGMIGVSGGLLSVSGNATIGQSSAGAVLTLQSGTVDTGSLSIGVGAPSGGGSVTVSGGVLDSAGLVQIGNGGTGFLTIDTGGSLIAGDGVQFQGAASSELLVNGGSASVTGGISIQDGLLEVTGGGVLTGDSTTQASNVGGGGPGNNGTLIVDGGTVSDTAAFFTVGGGSGASGTLIVDGGGLLTTTSNGNTAGQIDGGRGDAVASVDDGTWDVNGFLIVGNNTGDTGTLDINSGLVNAGTNAITIANLATSSGTVSVGSGGTLTGGGLTMADQSGSSGTLTVASGATVDLASIADGGGVIQVSGGLLSVSGVTTIGQGAGGQGAGGQGAGGQGAGGQDLGGGTLSQTSGTVDTAGLYIGNGTGVTGTVTVSGGVLDSTAQVQIGNQGDGLLAVDTGGSVTASGGLQVDSFGTGNGTVIVDGGAMTDSNGFSIGNGGSTGVASVTVEAGGVLSASGSNQFDIGSGGGTAAVVVSGGTFSTSGSSLEIGDTGGSASLLVENAGTVVAGFSGVGPAADINGTGGGEAGVTVSGSGSVWDIDGASGDQLSVGDDGSGSLTVSDGGVVDNGTNAIVMGNQNSGSGYVDVNGGGALLEGGSVSVGSGTSAGTLEIDTGGTVDVGSASVGQDGSLILDGGLLDPIALTLNSGGMISGFGTLDANLDNASMVTASGGALDVTGTISGSGTMAIAAGATLMLPNIVGSGQIIDFTANTGVLQIGTIGFGGTIGLDLQGDIQPGDTIVVTDVSDAILATVNPTDNMLQIVRAGFATIDLQLDPEANFLGDAFHVNTVGGNAVVTETAVPCYLAGTRILTDRGEVRVEKLCIGDRVVTLDGSARPIKWIGRRSYSGAIPTGQRDVIPILIKKGALGPKLPKRDLIVSPLHAMYCDGVLVPAEHLVNGVTVLRAPDIDPIRYFHIELDQHDVIYANGAPAETFVDCDSRAMFHNATEFDRLYPGDATPRWRYCAPRLEGGERLDAVKRAIDRRAGIALPEPGAPRGRLEGRLDGVEGGRISGWAFHPDRPVEPVWLEVLDGDGVIARVHARRYRADLEAAGVGDGRHGFELNLTGQMRTRRELRVRRVEDGVELEGSPLVVEARGGEALLEDARRVIAAAILDPSDEAALDALAAELLHGVDALRRARAGHVGAGRVGAGRVGAGRAGAGRAGPVEQLGGACGRRALIIDALLPRPEHDAGSQAILSHAAALTSLGFQVEFVAAHELARAEPASMALEQAGYVVHRAPRIASVEEVLRRHRNAFDVVYLHRLASAEAYAPLARTWQARARLLYCVADLHHVRLARQAAVQASAEVADAARAVRMRELNAMRLCDAVITHSTAEAAYLAQVAPGASVHVVAWTPEARPRPMPLAARQGVAAIGSWLHEPNVDAVRWLVSDIMPRVWAAAPGIELLVVGSDWPARVPWISDQRVRLVGAVTSIETLLGMLRLTVGALRFGAGLKGKVLDSFACEVPCVMTPVAAEGFPLEGALPGLVGEDAATLASLIVRLHEEPPFHRAAAADGLALAAKFSAEAVRAAMAAAVGLRTEATPAPVAVVGG